MPTGWTASFRERSVPWGTVVDTQAENGPVAGWRAYAAKHRWHRFDSFPPGIDKPRKVRIYRRGTHYILNWWDPGQKKNLSERVNSDLLAVLNKAREIDERILTYKTAGTGSRRRLTHSELVQVFLEDLGRRANAGEIDTATTARYRAALDHFLAFCTQTAVIKEFPYASSANREFRMAFTTFLQNREVHGNGRNGAAPKRMRGQRMVIDTVRALYEWARDADRGGLLPEGFKNPFLRVGEKRVILHGDPLAEPDITMTMAAEFLQACDGPEFALFAFLILFGLRAAEPCFLFQEHLQSDWLLVPNIPDLDYKTKGRRDKRFPLLPGLASFWQSLRSQPQRALLFPRRAGAEGKEQPPLLNHSLSELQMVYRDQIHGQSISHDDRKKLRNQLFADAGGVDYDEIETAFHRIHKKLGWPAAATLKDFRHLFATTLANAGMPEGYRKYLLGHAPGRDAAVAYTHLNKLREHYERIVTSEFAEVLDVIRNRYPNGPLVDSFNCDSNGDSESHQSLQTENSTTLLT
ncbi:hypothetical protein BH11PLA2_BH11PLA2_52350 [soil metagenome]